jgi:hypothetical protein
VGCDLGLHPSQQSCTHLSVGEVHAGMLTMLWENMSAMPAAIEPGMREETWDLDVRFDMSCAHCNLAQHAC